MHNYWDACIIFEKSYFARLYYIWYNQVKYNYVENAEEWEFGSYKSRVEKEKEELEKLKKKYPCDKVNFLECNDQRHCYSASTMSMHYKI